MLDLLDGLILAGGRDVDPVTYGEEPHPETDESRPERDHFELALATRAMERDMPFLGICRGMQVMNVARGGTLVQDLPEHLGHQDHRRSARHVRWQRPPRAPRRRARWPRARPARSSTARSRTTTRASATSATGSQVSGWSSDDELPEALEDPERRFALGVQWHPEADGESRVIAALVEEARTAR